MLNTGTLMKIGKKTVAVGFHSLLEVGTRMLLGMLGLELVSTGIVLQLLFPFSSSRYVMCELGPVLLMGLQMGDLGWKLFLSQLSW